MLTKINEIPNINIEIPLYDFCDLVNHMILEQTYYIRLTDNKMTVKDELLFWLQEHIEHMSLVADLLPIGVLKDNATQISDMLKDIRNASLQNPVYLWNSLEVITVANNILMQVTNTKDVDPQMVRHEMRETEHGLKRITSLLKDMN